MSILVFVAGVKPTLGIDLFTLTIVLSHGCLLSTQLECGCGCCQVDPIVAKGFLEQAQLEDQLSCLRSNVASTWGNSISTRWTGHTSVGLAITKPA